MKKAEGIKESTETVEGSKVKEEKLEVAGGNCWRGSWKSALHVTGEKFNEGHVCKCQRWGICCSEAKMKYFTEHWILPFVVLCALVAYAVLAIVYYNKDG